MRQLEAIVRICEALAKIELMPFVEERHIDEALRLFRVSTIEAASSGSLAGSVFHVKKVVCKKRVNADEYTIFKSNLYWR